LGDPSSAARRSWRPDIGAAAAVALAYYLGAQVGFALRTPPLTTSILWVPNAVLCTALLLSPPRRWWLLLLAALPVHVALQMAMGRPLHLVLALYASNCLEAAIGASLVHAFSQAPDRVDTLRRAGLFIFAVVLIAPVSTSFIDAAVVAAFGGDPYWQVWQTRIFANALTALAVVPVLVALVRMPRSRKVSARRCVEAAALALCLVVVASRLFPDWMAWPHPSLAWPEQPLFVLLLPPLLWAATRFGAAGSSLALLMTALIALFAATTRAVDDGSQVRQQVRHLQAFLLLAGIPLFGLGALIEERRAREEELHERLRFEELLSRISAALVHLPSDWMEAAFEDHLGRIGEHYGLRCLHLVGLAAGSQPALAASWFAPSSVPPPAAPRPGEVFTRASTHGEWRDDDGQGTRSLGVPIRAGDVLLGALVLSGPARPTSGRAPQPAQLHLLAQVFAGALARKQGEDALRASEAMKSAILASLSGHVAVLDRNGRIIAANATWPEAGPGHAGPGLPYAEACRLASHAGLPDAPEAVEGVRAVLEGARSSFLLEYPCRTEAGERWFMLSVVPLRRGEGGAVAAHMDVTERRRAEEDARLSREELAHFLRVSTVGELTASLAHELNQPLAAILANAQAARLTLAGGGDPGGVAEMLADIEEEDKRAGEVIRRLRELLRKRQPERERLDLNALAADVARLIANDAALRNVTIRLDLAARPSMVNADRIQIQQVVLNLLVNAMDAMADAPEARRTAQVATCLSDHAVQLSVSDTGTGLQEGPPERLFEPFYTTKAAGMGMGLAIARSIVAAHGGRIWGRNNAGPGATFTLSLPPAGPAEA
jgi:signal transduction histidine kinase/integral membrane sensor domain MASE1